MRLPFDRPFAYTHTRDLVWMIDFPPSNSLPIQTDWAVRDRDTVITGEQQGVGCFNTWDNRLAELRGDVAATQNASAFKVSLACSGLRPNSLTHVLLGASPTATYYSFLCGFQYVDNVLLGALTVSDASGGIASREFARIPYQVPLVGLSAHAQAYCLDDGRHPALLPVTLTNGLRLEFPLMAPTWHSATWVAGNAYAATGGGLNDGMIAVTQFTQ